MPRTATRPRPTFHPYGFASHDEEMEKSRKRFNIMRTVALCFIAFVFLVVIAGFIFMAVNFAHGGGFSYDYSYQFGGVTYHEGYSVNR